MPEPTSSGVAGAAVAYKAFGGTAAAVASGATLAAAAEACLASGASRVSVCVLARVAKDA